MSTTRTPALLTDTDMEVMRILHGAFRRDGARLEAAAERYGTQEAAAHEALLIGWHGMSSSLHHHHTIEDTHIWPVIRGKVTGGPDVEVLDAMEEEHSRIDPAIERIERAFADPDVGVDSVAESIDAFLSLLRSHLDHEERDAFPLIRRFITKSEWDSLNQAALKELSMSEIVRQTRDVGLSVVGPYGTLHAYDRAERPALDAATGNPFLAMVTEVALFAQGPPIYGGTDQVQRNIIGERVLGLPKDAGIDSKTPFREMLKN